MSQSPSQAVGQVSADWQFRWDGAQWVPIPKGEREPTPWTRPMQLAAAAVFAVEAVWSVIATVVFVNHDSMLRALQAQGTQFPSGTDIDTVVNVAIGLAIAVAIVVAVFQLVAAAGSYLGWRWMFWVALALFGLAGLSALGNISTFAKPSISPFPIAAVTVSTLVEVACLAMFVWLVVGAVRYGPWAMKKPGA